MRNIACAVFFTVGVFAGAAFGTQAQAMSAAAPSLRGLATAHALPIQQVRNICGMNGCAPVFVKRYTVPPRNISKTTAPPLVVSNSPAPVQAQSALPSLPSLPSLPALPSLSSLLSPLGLGK